MTKYWALSNKILDHITGIMVSHFGSHPLVQTNCAEPLCICIGLTVLPHLCMHHRHYIKMDGAVTSPAGALKPVWTEETVFLAWIPKPSGDWCLCPLSLTWSQFYWKHWPHFPSSTYWSINSDWQPWRFIHSLSKPSSLLLFTHTLSSKAYLESQINPHVIGLWEETEVPSSITHNSTVLPLVISASC